MDGWRELIENFADALIRAWCLPIPTVAAVTGHAVAGGCILASACDHVVALAGPYRFQMNELVIGLPIPTWAAIICQDAWPVPQINDLLFTARAFSPEEAHALGVVRAIEKDEAAVIETAKAAAEAMAFIHREPYAVSKRQLRSERAEYARAAVETDFQHYSLEQWG
jgi:enoyl-CoA hydratase